MGKIFATVLVVTCFVFLGCYSDDDGSRYIRLSIEDALVFDNEENYVVGDTIFVDLNFSRYLPEEGYDNLLDIYESSGSESFYYNYGLSKFSELSNGFRTVAIDSSFLFAEKGNIDGYRGADVVLNANQTQYESRIGLILAESGIFRFDFDFLNIYSNNYSRDHVQIEIQNIFSTTQTNFEFTVAEE